MSRKSANSLAYSPSGSDASLINLHVVNPTSANTNLQDENNVGQSQQPSRKFSTSWLATEAKARPKPIF